MLKWMGDGTMRNVYKKTIALALVLAGSLCVSAIPAKTSEAAAGGTVMGQVPEYAVADSYDVYLSRYESAGSGSDTVTLKGSDYVSADGMEVTVDGDTVMTGTDGQITWDVDVNTAGFYQIDMEYAAVPDGGNDIQMRLLLNGELPFAQASPLVFYRMYANADESYKEMEGNQSFPSQIEVADWQKVSLKDAEGFFGDDKGLKFYLEKGKNTLTFEAVKDRMMIRGITLRPAEELQDYASWLAARQEEGAQIMTTGTYRIQGEDAALKSNPSFYPQNDRTSPLSEPYDPTYIVLNTIGGSGWKKAGDWLEWKVDVPAAGLYRIAMRYKQKDSVGFSGIRAVSVNGSVPYAEAQDIRFPYSNSFQTNYLQSVAGEDLYFYFEEGTNTVRLTCSLGAYAEAASELRETIDEISEIYYSITAITSTAPTKYQDYQLTRRLPNLTTELQHAGERLADICSQVMEITGGTTDVSSSIDRSADMFLEIAEYPSRITDKITTIGDSITSLGSAVLTLSQQALTIDWMELQGTEEKLPPAEGNFFQNAKHEIQSFIGSFTNDYNVAADSEEAGEGKTITVWVSTGRDQMDVLRRLINESFTSRKNIKVELKLVDISIIMTAVAGGTGPDVLIGASNTMPMELGYRGAAYDLKQFSDYGETAAMFAPAAVDSYAFEGKQYGLPDQMSFPVLFYRSDILAQYGIMVPETWEDLVSIIPSLATYNMQVYLDRESIQTLGAASGVGTSKAINSVYLSMLYQNGGELYDEAGKETLLLSEESVDCFETWTDYYTKYGFSATISFVTRFRLGSVPLAIMDISNYNTLSVSAPEISGKWGISLVPGTRREDGTVDHSIPVTTSSVVMIKPTVERDGTMNEAWEFIKWWVSADVQTGYAREMEAVLGSSGRYMVANLESFEQTSWPVEIAAVLDDSLYWLREIRQIPGSYLTGRNLENAFYAVINDISLDPLDTLAGYVESIDAEIIKKRQEYGLDTK